MKLDFSKKRAIVTGASSGIGRAIAEMLLDLNAEVLVTATKKMPSWCRGRTQCRFRAVDFLDENSFSDFLKEVKEFAPEILVNNAGLHVLEEIDQVKTDNWERILMVNLTAPMKLLRAVTPKMKSRRQGRVVNVASIAGIVSKPTSTAYSASKSGLIGLTRSSALALAPYNVLVNSLCPGYTDTDMIKRLLTVQQKRDLMANVPLKRLASPKEIAHFALFLVSDLNTYITGQTIVVDGGETAQ